MHLYFSLLADIEVRNNVKQLQTILLQGLNIYQNAVLMIPGKNDPELYVVYIKIEVEPQKIIIIAKNVTGNYLYNHHFQAYELYSRDLHANWFDFPIKKYNQHTFHLSVKMKMENCTSQSIKIFN